MPDSLALVENSDLREEVRQLLAAPELQEELNSTWRTPPHEECPPPRLTYRALGGRGLLAPHWPPAYGGRGAEVYATAVVAEELALHGVPDSARVNTIDNAGATLLSSGTERQRRRYCPDMAAGRVTFSVLYTEPDAGSDLGGMATRAERTPDGWRLTGTKTWNATTADARYGICAARVAGGGDNAYAATALFVVPLDHPAVRVEALRTINPERFFTVRLDGAEVDDEALIGSPGAGWSMLTQALGLERTGICFAGRARRWLDQLVRALEARGAPALPGGAAELPRLDAEVASARLLGWRAVADLADGRLGAAAAAAAKWWSSELAQRVAWLAWDLLGPQGSPAFPDLMVAVREAPGLTLAAGTSEMQLSTVVTDLLDGGDPWEEQV
ncbi:acyl-CoA dehydrogenase family protein [Streptomyces naphthomycinicus]|uniref:acyl-CoA dehydrogenase family protein n=1 Tax=Streptomyces naphthomycinicus TaxID=2872625 RepID=UPI001CECE329|nr:acyl-CoA dehydrogenase family protein [Streptomyces sp. TML10]